MNRRDTDRKPSNTNPENPKDRVAGRKTPFGLSPDSATIGMEIAFTEGALKYGRYNWRVAGVSASIYRGALGRHIAKWWNGQDRDPETRVHHLDNALACIAIMRDAIIYGKLNDDRPPCPDPDAMARHIDESAETIQHLKEMFKDHNPTQYTIADTRAPVVPEGTVDEETYDDSPFNSFATPFAAPSDPTKLPQIVDGAPWREAWAIVDGNGNLLSLHASHADAESCMRVMMAPEPVNTPEELAELVKMQGVVRLVGGPGLVDGGHIEHPPVICSTPGCWGNPGHEGPHLDLDGKTVPDLAAESAGDVAFVLPPYLDEAEQSRVDALSDRDEQAMRGLGADEEGLERCGQMSSTKRVCTRMGGHAGAHADAVVHWAGVE